MTKVFLKEQAQTDYSMTGAMEAETISKNGRNLKSHTSRGNFQCVVLTLIGLLFFSSTFAQDYKNSPKENERVIGTVIGTINSEGRASWPNYDEVYIYLLEKAKKEFPNKVIDIRNVTKSDISSSTTTCSAKVIELNSNSPETKLNETFVKAIDKAMSSIRASSRLAIDQISASGGLDRETVKDQLLDILLDKGYKVVAKEYLEKLKEEQEQQQSGGYNEKTTARTDNFSGVGYFLNVRVNEKSIRVQVINVSTGEYEGNATVEF